ETPELETVRFETPLALPEVSRGTHGLLGAVDREGEDRGSRAIARILLANGRPAADIFVVTVSHAQADRQNGKMKRRVEGHLDLVIIPVAAGTLGDGGKELPVGRQNSHE